MLIETERLYIRKILSTDAEGLFEMDSDSLVHQYLGNNPLTDIQQARDVIAFLQKQYEDYGIARWSIISKEDDAFVGWTGFKYMTEIVNGHSNYYDFGYRLCSKYWGRGYATEAGRAAMQYGIDVLGFKDVYAMTHPENMASRRVLEKVGMRYVGMFAFDCAAFASWRGLGEPTTWFELAAAGQVF